MRTWRANTDMSVLHNLFKGKKYVTKYASKPETKSSLFVSSAKTVFSDDCANLRTKDLLRRVMTKVLSERDIAVMEAIHLLMGWHLHKSNITVANVNLVSSRNLLKNKNNTIEIKDSLVDLYAKREDVLQAMNIDAFSKKYKCSKGKRSTRPNSDLVAIRFFQKYSSNPDGEYYPLFCKFQLLRYKAWSNNHANALATDSGDNRLDDNDQGWIQSWRIFLESAVGQSVIPEWSHRYNEVNRRWDSADVIDMLEMDQENSAEDEETYEQEEWQLNMNPLQEHAVGAATDSFEASEEMFERERAQYTSECLDQMPQWVSNAKKDAGDAQVVYEQVDVNLLNADQLLAYTIVKRHFETASDKQLLLRVEGQGG